jgi:hypothetical protein
MAATPLIVYGNITAPVVQCTASSHPPATTGPVHCGPAGAEWVSRPWRQMGKAPLQRLRLPHGPGP